MWCGTFFIPNEMWCVPSATMIQPAAYSTKPGTSSGSGCPPWPAGLSGQVLLQPADIGGQAAVDIGGLADDGGARGADHAEQQRGVDGPGGDVGVPVAARTELIPRVVAVHQVDPAGDRLDPVDR